MRGESSSTVPSSSTSTGTERVPPASCTARRCIPGQCPSSRYAIPATSSDHRAFSQKWLKGIVMSVWAISSELREIGDLQHGSRPVGEGFQADSRERIARVVDPRLDDDALKLGSA